MSSAMVPTQSKPATMNPAIAVDRFMFSSCELCFSCTNRVLLIRGPALPAVSRRRPPVQPLKRRGCRDVIERDKGDGPGSRDRLADYAPHLGPNHVGGYLADCEKVFCYSNGFRMWNGLARWIFQRNAATTAKLEIIRAKAGIIKAKARVIGVAHKHKPCTIGIRVNGQRVFFVTRQP